MWGYALIGLSLLCSKIYAFEHFPKFLPIMLVFILSKHVLCFCIDQFLPAYSYMNVLKIFSELHCVISFVTCTDSFNIM